MQTIVPTDDLRIVGVKQVLTPTRLREELPLPAKVATHVIRSREEIAQVFWGRDSRLAIVVGPCSIHDPVAGLEYARRLQDVAQRFRSDLLVVMRVYFEKPRTTVGWKGLINDPGIDESYRIDDGLRTARGFLLDVAGMGLATGCEFLDPITPQFIADVVSWGAIGARTVESQVHRELASGLSMPVGFKNSTGGDVQVAIDAIRSAAHPHHFLSVGKNGMVAIVSTRGNAECHLILRGGSAGHNYDAQAVGDAVERLGNANLARRVMIDCSHANSGKRHERQPMVAENVADQIRTGSTHIAGVMLESFLEDGRQDYADRQSARFGQSITDACMGWQRTTPLFEMFAEAVRERRKRLEQAGRIRAGGLVAGAEGRA